MSGLGRLLLSVMLLFFALFQVVKADYGVMSTFENVDYVSQDITLLENGTANIDFILVIENDTITQPGAFMFSLDEARNQEFTAFKCTVMVWNASVPAGSPNRVLLHEEWNASRSKNMMADRIRKIGGDDVALLSKYGRSEIPIEFNRVAGSTEELDCNYGIANYAEERRPVEWVIADNFGNKHGADHFIITIRIPKNTAFETINPAQRNRNICNPNENCQEVIVLVWDENSEYKAPSIYVTYKKISPDLSDIVRRYVSMEFVVSSFIAAMIAIVIEKVIEHRKKIIDWLVEKLLAPKRKSRSTRKKTKAGRQSKKSKRKKE